MGLLTQEKLMSAIGAPESHPLFEISKDLRKIDSPVELGYHPDTVLSVFDYFVIHLSQMSQSGVRGDNFVAIRCAPVQDYHLTHAKVECVYLRAIEGKWVLHKLGKALTESEFQEFSQLAQGKEVKMGPQLWKRI